MHVEQLHSGRTRAETAQVEAVPAEAESAEAMGSGNDRSRVGWARAASITRTTLLNVAAVLGSVCIVLVVLAMVFNITLIMFKTGSMSPTIPTGSLAVVRQIPAQDAKVGDVVTVDRPGLLPVTHRIVSTHAGEHGTTVLTLKGDANPTADPAPYTVRTVRLVMWSVPGLAYFVVWLSNPIVLGALTLAVAALIVWVLWPRDDDRRPARHAQQAREPQEDENQ
jgi:signal peptidase